MILERWKFSDLICGHIESVLEARFSIRENRASETFSPMENVSVKRFHRENRVSETFSIGEKRVSKTFSIAMENVSLKRFHGENVSLKRFHQWKTFHWNVFTNQKRLSGPME